MNSPRGRILVIDDDAGIRESIKDILALENWDCVVAASGQEGLKLIASYQPELVVTDVQLPDISGYQICQTMKRDPAARRIPIVMISGRFTEKQDRIQGFELGADEFLSKPFDPVYFVARIRSMLKAA